MMINCIIILNHKIIIDMLQLRTDSTMLQLAEKSHAETIGQVEWFGHNITPVGILNFSKGRWDHLKILIISGGHLPFMGDRGCKYLSRVHLPQIESINLKRNRIGENGMVHLSKAPWKAPDLLSLICSGDFEMSVAAVHSLQMLVRANWPSLKDIWFQDQLITTEPLKFLLLSQNVKVQIIARSFELDKFQFTSVQSIFKMKKYRATF